LLLALLFIELSDIVFAVDSVPAIFAITREPLIVFTSNVFAILGLRSLYFLLAGAVHSFHLLKYRLALVLIFVGLKMAWLNELFGGKFPIGISLAVIAGIVGGSMLLSFLIPWKTSAISRGVPKSLIQRRGSGVKMRPQPRHRHRGQHIARYQTLENSHAAGRARGRPWQSSSLRFLARPRPQPKGLEIFGGRALSAISYQPSVSG
jgi:hypothetical protein